MPQIITYIKTPIAKLEAILEDDHLIRLHFLNEDVEKGKHKNLFSIENKITQKLQAEISRYFENPKYQIKFKIKTSGTSFQEKVWAYLRKIPTGETISYGDVAKALKSGPRAVGQACRTNPIPLITPCHRVIAANGTLGGFMGKKHGDPFNIKIKLLTHEGVNI